MNLFISCSHLRYINDEKGFLFSMTLNEFEESIKYYENQIPLKKGCKIEIPLTH